MNPLLSIKGTIISGFVLAIVFIMILGCEKKELKNQVHYLQDEVDELEVEVKDLEKENKNLFN